MPESRSVNEAFQALVKQVIDLAQAVPDDTGEWGQYAAICQDAGVTGLTTYAQRCSSELWTDGLDQTSWTLVQQAAARAAQQGSDQAALYTILEGFVPITNPSNNPEQWAALRTAAGTLMVQVDALRALMLNVVALNAVVSSDEGEWGQYADICAAAAETGIRTYIQRCSAELWTDGMDESSWALVKQAAATAAAQQDDRDALITILEGFVPITNPSQNSSEWAILRATAQNILTEVEPFQALMKEVEELNAGISTDEGEWDKYAEICRDASSSGIRTYIQRCSTELWTDGMDESSWAIVKQAAAAAAHQESDQDALNTILTGFFDITSPSQNAEQWAALSALTARHIYQDGSAIPFNGIDDRARRSVRNPLLLPKEMSSSFLIKRAGLPARYEEATFLDVGKRCHVEYFMRLQVTDQEGSAYFIITHSQDNGGYVALAKVPGANAGQGPHDHEITVAEPDFAGEVVWWDLLDGSHPGGCNHPGNGGQVGDITVLCGQDWTKWYPVYGYVVEPVSQGSKVLFYDFSSLRTGQIPSMGSGENTSNAYMGCLTTAELGLLPGHDGEVQSVNVEQGPDGLYYLIAGNPGQTVVWKSPELVPDISMWTNVRFGGAGELSDGSSALAWSSFSGEQSLYYVTSGHNGMSFRNLKYDVVDGEVVAVYVEPNAGAATYQSDAFGDDDWVADNGSIYAGASQGIALYGAYKSINDQKGPSEATQQPCIQVRAWYSPPQ